MWDSHPRLVIDELYTVDPVFKAVLPTGYIRTPEESTVQEERSQLAWNFTQV
jgi:hypothetical protein